MVQKTYGFVRDSDPRTHPHITLKNEIGTIRFPKPMANPVKINPEHPPVLNPQNITAIPITPQDGRPTPIQIPIQKKELKNK